MLALLCNASCEDGILSVVVGAGADGVIVDVTPSALFVMIILNDTSVSTALASLSSSSLLLKLDCCVQKVPSVLIARADYIIDG